METRSENRERAEHDYVSTGHLPSPEQVKALVAEAHARFQSNTEGQNSHVYPALAEVPSDLFGVCVVGTSGNVYAVGDTDYEFSIMSVSKPFVFALVCEVIGPEQAREKLGANSTGLPFNSLAAIERSAGRADQSDGECGRDRDDQPRAGRDRRRQVDSSSTTGLSRFAGRKLPLNEEVYASASETNFRNRSIARLLQSLRPHLLRSGRGDRPLHPAVLAQRERQGSGGDGRDAGRRRRQSAHQGAGRRARPSATMRWP